MSLAERLVEHPQREVGGSVAQERFDYQALWGLALIFSNHGKSEDYAIAFEFHDDVVLLDSSKSDRETSILVWGASGGMKTAQHARCR